jgi:hypothetical protein
MTFSSLFWKYRHGAYDGRQAESIRFVPEISIPVRFGLKRVGRMMIDRSKMSGVVLYRKAGVVTTGLSGVIRVGPSRT